MAEDGRSRNSRASRMSAERRAALIPQIDSSPARPSESGDLSATGSTGRVRSQLPTNGSPMSAGSTGAVAPRPIEVQSGAKRHMATAHPRRKSVFSSPVTVVIVAMLGVVFLIGAYNLAKRFLPSLASQAEEAQDIAPGQQVQVIIPEGAGGGQIGEILKEAGVIDSLESFSNEVQRQGVEQTLKSGSYQLVTGSAVGKVVEQLVAGPNDTSGKVTVPEGLTVRQTARRLSDTLDFDADSFVSAAKASEFADDFGFLSEAGDDSLEGFLAPKTYDFSGMEVEPSDVIETMLKQWQTDYGSLGYGEAAENLYGRYGVRMSRYDFLRLASIIEREAVNDDDRPLVSSVFYNRMSAGMALQSDATMGYVTGGEVTAADLETASPYNTYLNAGLPPTPICTPSVESIEAALHPADTEYYYFFILEDGDYSNHTFSETYEQHLEAIERAGNRE